MDDKINYDTMTFIGKLWYWIKYPFKGLSERYSAYDWFLLAISILSCVVTSVYIFTGSIEYFSSDSAGISLLGKEQQETGSLCPKGWNNATSIWIWGLNLVVWVLSYFISDAILIRNISVFVFFLVSIGLIVLLSRILFKNRSYLLIIPFFACGFSSVYTEMLFSQAAYLFIVVSVFALLVVFYPIFSDKLVVRWKMVIPFVILYSLLSFYKIDTVQGVGIPIFAAIVLYILFKTYNEKISVLIKYKNQIILLGVIALTILANFLLYRLVLSPALSSSDNYADRITVFGSIDGILDNIQIFLQSVLFLCGYGFGINLLSAEGIIALFKFVCLIMLLGYFPIKLTMKYKELNGKMQIFVIFVWIHVFEVIILTLCGSIGSFLAGSRYLITSAVLLITMSGYYLYTYVFSKYNIYSLLISCCLVAYSVFCSIPVIQSSVNYKEILKSQTAITDFLLENGLNYGYATFWNAGNNTVLSDYRVRISPVNIGDDVTPYHWFCNDRFFNPDMHEGKSFLLLRDNEVSAYTASTAYKWFGEPSSVLAFPGYSIFVYEYNISQNDFSRTYKYSLGTVISYSADSYNCNNLLQGWSGNEEWGVWSEGNESALRYDIPEENNADLVWEIEACSFNSPKDVDVFVNGNKVDTFLVDTDTGRYSISIPSEFYVKNTDDADNVYEINITMRLTADVSPADINPGSSDTRKLGIGLIESVLSLKQ